MSETLRIGIIGGGRIGKVHATSITTRVPSAKVVALADKFMNDKLRDWCHGMGIMNTPTDPEEIIKSSDIDAVLICSPTNTHSQLIQAAAKAGKHIFCEKPVDTDLKRIAETMEVVRKSGVKFQIGFNRRFDHNHMAVRQQVENGTIGKVHIVKVTSRDPAPPTPAYVAVSGGIFLDMMIHDFDMVRYLSGQEVEEVYATGAVLIDEGIGKAGDVDTAVVSMKLSGGALAIIDNSRQAVYGYDQRTEVFGEKGCAMVGNDRPSLVEVSTKDTVSSEKPLYFFLDRYMDSYAREVGDFVASVIGDKPTLCGIDDAIRPVEIALAATKSLKEGRPVAVSEVRYIK
ncbi:MAG: inositol 2-dehydrogenase [Spirochaetia bacterium]|jgi:myo-inositol 2-dehydrogenase/D-chiro-inositol 1-dehydrogenase|nr:inositol 2-dehydrogenase [Spirochaetia bacterium]